MQLGHFQNKSEFIFLSFLIKTEWWFHPQFPHMPTSKTKAFVLFLISIMIMLVTYLVHFTKNLNLISQSILIQKPICLHLKCNHLKDHKKAHKTCKCYLKKNLFIYKLAKILLFSR